MDTSHKIIALNDIAARLAAVRQNKTVVFTNGCFDILHKGHVDYLQKARDLGDFLCVGLNADASIKIIKGAKRPIVPQDERAFVLAALACVDFVVVFNEADPYNLIKTAKPDILVKGTDWGKDQIIGADVVESYGGRVELIPLVAGCSSTNIIETVLERHKPCCHIRS